MADDYTITENTIDENTIDDYVLTENTIDENTIDDYVLVDRAIASVVWRCNGDYGIDIDKVFGPVLSQGKRIGFLAALTLELARIIESRLEKLEKGADI